MSSRGRSCDLRLTGGKLVCQFVGLTVCRFDGLWQTERGEGGAAGVRAVVWLWGEVRQSSGPERAESQARGEFVQLSLLESLFSEACTK